jgi:hypothetical protein
MGLMGLITKGEINDADILRAGADAERLLLLEAEGSSLLVRLDSLSDVAQKRPLTADERMELAQVMRLLRFTAGDCVVRLKRRLRGELETPVAYKPGE